MTATGIEAAGSGGALPLVCARRGMADYDRLPSFQDAKRLGRVADNIHDLAGADDVR
jgi:hypothetical protein